jgi:hypothetical protein
MSGAAPGTGVSSTALSSTALSSTALSSTALSSTEAHLAHNVVGPVVFAESVFTAASRLEVLVAAHHLITAYRRCDAFLVVAGAPVDADFIVALQRYADELNLTRTWLAPGADVATLDAFSHRADVHVRWDPSLAASGAEVLADALTALVDAVDAEHGPQPDGFAPQ